MRRVLTALAAAAMLAAAAAQPAAATFPGKPGHIAFSRSGTGSFPSNADIWVADRSGGHQRRLTGTRKASETSPAYSPNGRLIAFVRRSRGDADVWVMRADGTHERQITDSEEDELQPSFYPSGEALLFTRFDGERGWDVFSIRIRGAKNLKHQFSNATFPVVSPNGDWIAYSATQDGVGGIRLHNPRSGRTRRLTTGSAQDLDFSPSGRTITFSGQRHCNPGGRLRFVILTIGLHDDRSTTVRRPCNREFISPCWSPNGRRLVFAHKKLAARGADLRFRLGMLLPDGTQVGGAPHHRRGTNELDPAWQPLRG